MNIIVTLFKALAASLTTGQLLTVLALIGSITVFLIHLIIKNRKILGTFFLGHGDADSTKQIADIRERLAGTATTEEVERAIEEINRGIRDHNAGHTRDMDQLRDRLHEITLLRQEIQSSNERLAEDHLQLMQRLNLHETSEEAQVAQLLMAMNKSQDLLQRALLHLEKIDEFIKAAVPEFRGYHRELNGELRDLSRDIALVERTVQSQVNNGAAVKLR